MWIALLVVALTWKGGHLTGDYREFNRYQQTEVPTLAALQQSWSQQLTRSAWSRELLPLQELIPVVSPPVQVFEPLGPPVPGWATHYGEAFAGGVLSCGTGEYDPANPDIVAVGPSRYLEWPCGTLLRVCGPAGCATVTRHDSCPGCGPSVLDLSEAGNELVCGSPPHTCKVTIEVVFRVSSGQELGELSLGR